MASKRNITRETILQTLFEDEFHHKEPNSDNLIKIFDRINKELKDLEADKEYAQKILKGIASKRGELDKIIESVATNWPIDRILIVDRNILRIGLFEILFASDLSTPPKVAINEAIEVAKKFGGAQSYKFINGVLGKIYEQVAEGKESKEVVPAKKIKFSVGALVYTKKDDVFCFAFVKDVLGKWTLPKKKIEKTDDSSVVVRECVQEELGLSNTSVISELNNISFISHPPEGPIRKDVKYFLLYSEEGNLVLGDAEGLLEAKWVEFDKVDDLKKYKDLNSVIKLGLEEIKKSSYSS